MQTNRDKKIFVWKREGGERKWEENKKERKKERTLK